METDAGTPANIQDDQSEWPEVSIIILNWNSYEDTAACLSSLRDVQYPNITVYVIDNGSRDGSAERLKAEYPEYEYIINDQNLGFAAGCNRGIEKAFEEGVEYILLLNNDTTVQPGFLNPLVCTAEDNPDAAAVGGIIYNAETGDVWSAGGEFNPTFTRIEQNTNPGEQIYETRFISGALMLIRREFLQELGGLNESYFFGMEDEELSCEARQRGYRLLINPESRIEHFPGSSATSPFRHYHSTRNRFQFAADKLPVRQAITFYCFFITTRVIRFTQWWLGDETTLIRATVLAIADHFQNAPPRMVSDFDT